ncbi:Metallo-dependent hydrolase [Phaeosphaeriaceae sp. SRC1lsM3a]|nr:Metallo-dependent hydrolase [Stagonospora sp. SRC1lsM3a]
MRELFDKALEDTKAINKYNDNYAKLLRSERETAWDRAAWSANDQEEQHAANVIREMREYERRVVFGNLASEAIPGTETRDMGGQFLTNKERINHESLLFQIARKVPKGGLLHVHFNSELHPERLLERARLIDNIYIRSIRPLLSQKDLDETEMVFNVLDNDQVEKGVSIFSPTYPGNATNWKTPEWTWKVWQPWKDFQKEFESKFPGKYLDQPKEVSPVGSTCCSEPAEPGSEVELSPAEKWLKSKMVLSEEEAYGFTQTVNGVWARFNQATRCFKGLLNYEDVYKWYIGEAIERMIEEHVMYAELRPMLLDKFIPTNDGKGKIDNAAQMRLIIDGVQQKKLELEQRGELDKFPFGLKIIYCTPRSIPKKMMREEMKQCIELKMQFPDLICGFDLVGAEDRPNHIGFYREELVAFQRTCTQRGLEIPFLFHAGETLLDTGGSSDPSNSNLYDAVILGSKRIGHGFALMKHPLLVEKFKKTARSEGICVELCPISNELLHLCRNIKEHPFPELLAAGIPCTVNSDNPSLFSNSMSHEFYQIMVGSPSMSLYSWKQLARWSIDYSCLSKVEKIRGHEILDSEWKAFCRNIIKEYGHIMDGDKIDEAKAKEEYESRKHDHF